MKRYLTLISFLFLFSDQVLADWQADQEITLAQNGVTASNASGDSQTTFIDQNGNLKMIPSESHVTKSNVRPPPGMSSAVAPSTEGQLKPSGQAPIGPSTQQPLRPSTQGELGPSIPPNPQPGMQPSPQPPQGQGMMPQPGMNQ